MTMVVLMINVPKMEKQIPQISWFTAWLALDESRIQSGRNRCWHHFQFGSQILLNSEIHQPVKIAQKLHTKASPQYSAMEEGVNKQCGQVWEEAAVDQVNNILLCSNKINFIKIMQKRKPIFNSTDRHSCTFFQALFIRYSSLIVEKWYMWKYNV